MFWWYILFLAVYQGHCRVENAKQIRGTCNTKDIPTEYKVTCSADDSSFHRIDQAVQEIIQSGNQCLVSCKEETSLSTWIKCVDGKWIGKGLSCKGASSGVTRSERRRRFLWVDTDAPNIKCPSDKTVWEYRDGQSKSVTWDDPSTDDKGGWWADHKVDIEQSSGSSRWSTFPVGSNKICYRAKDHNGNKSPECCFHIHVNRCPAKSDCKARYCNNGPYPRCSACYSGYYLHGSDCYRCSSIKHCTAVTCTNFGNSICTKCNYENPGKNESLYWRINGATKCEATCSHKDQWCWPGSCRDTSSKEMDLLRPSCKCDQDFQWSGSSNAKCQIKKKPSLTICRAKVVDKNGEAKYSSYHGECEKEGSVYINFLPVSIDLTFKMSFDVNITMQQPTYINDSHFGIVTSDIKVTNNRVSGVAKPTGYNFQLQSKSDGCNRDFSSTSPSHGLVSCHINETVNITMFNGDWLCIVYTTYGGGFLVYQDFGRHLSPKQVYSPVSKSKEVCFRYDVSKPRHCSDTKSCSEEPIQVENKTTTDGNLTVDVSGWLDLSPVVSMPLRASGVNRYEINIHEMISEGNTMKMSPKSVNKNPYVLMENQTDKIITVSLPFEPALFGISILVLDVAGNIGQARRFVYYDNSSRVKIDHSKIFRFESASAATNFTWQTHHGSICMSYTDRYYNSHNADRDKNVLRPISPDENYKGVYEQLSGQLSVNGTPNIYGITELLYRVRLDQGLFSNFLPVKDFLNQSFCTYFPILDGQVITYEIVPKDIMNQSLTEEKSIYIDASVPDIFDIWLVRDNQKQLFVHNTSDLSKMNFEFKVRDDHSGIHSIFWSVGTSPGGSDLGQKAIAVQKINGTCGYKRNCYCPAIGNCEVNRYSVDMNSLVKNNTHIGTHNREYFFNIMAINNARLHSINRIDVLSDESPPSVGVVREGPSGYPDVDFSGSRDIIVSWDGFVDHESGIRQYRVAFAKHCLSSGSIVMNNTGNMTVYMYETKQQSMRFNVKEYGKYFTTVVAFNNAMEPSEPVCSDGITIDNTKPELGNLSLLHAKAKEVIGCFNGQAFLILINLTAVQLSMTEKCINVCNKSKTMDLIEYLPQTKSQSNDSDIADTLCTRTTSFDSNWFIYIPTDKIYISWNVTDTESQIRDIQVGFSSDPSYDVSPDLNAYQNADSFTKYSKSHSGLDRGDVFYILLKSTNKADIHTLTKVGPIIIDETAPIYNGGLEVVTSDENIYCIWQNYTFKDMEQREELSFILFRIGSGYMLTTPYLQANIHKNCPKDGFRCFSYPLFRLQAQDSESGNTYHIEIHLYNTAGHYLSLNSPKFEIPSIYPPGRGTVVDVDPDDIMTMDYGEDIDFLQRNTHICGAWSGFYHHKNVTFHVGLGSKADVADIKQLRLANDSRHACVKANALQSFRKYYFIVKAMCEGGSTIVSSDGIVLLEATEVLQSLDIHNGRRCTNKSILWDEHVQYSTVTIPVKLVEGEMYTIWSDCSNGFPNSDNVVFITNDTFIPTSSQPLFKTGLQERIQNRSCRIIVSDCFSDLEYISSSLSLHAYWDVSDDIMQVLTAFKVALYDEIKASFVTSYENVKRKQEHTFNSTFWESIIIQHKLRIAVICCFSNICLPPRFSATFISEIEEPCHEPLTATIANNDDFMDITVSFEAFTCATSGPAAGYGLVVYTSKERRTQLSNIFTFQARNRTKIKETISIPLGVYLHYNPLVCIQSVCKSGVTCSSCQTAVPVTSPNMFDSSVLYEIELNTFKKKGLEKLVTSKIIGSELSILHQSEANFLKPQSNIAGIILGSDYRNIKWFLMKKPFAPSLCESALECVASTVSIGGVGIFRRSDLENNVKYFICASSKETIIERETSAETLGEFNVCGNGFVIDNSPPILGSVKIESNEHGFLDEPNVRITWKGFSDTEGKVQGRVESGIATYDLALGSYPGGQDIISFSTMGRKTSIVLRNIQLKNGVSCFATVRAFDFVGHMTTALSEGVTLDTTPPEIGVVVVGDLAFHRTVISSENFRVHWEGVTDPESGIQLFEMSLSSSKSFNDILYTQVLNDGMYEDRGMTDHMVDGHHYFVAITATNRAGLSSTTTSEAFTFDSSPPEGGVVRDGVADHQTDIDFQVNTTSLSCHWVGFDDGHSGVVSYEVGIGTVPNQWDVSPLRYNDLRTEYTTHSVFVPGEKYYCTVRACNGAGLCTTRTSDGVTLDNSPPIPGIVHVGFSDRHQHYLSHRNFISARWVGFQDPHSGIASYEWCIGTAQGLCDVLNMEDCQLSDNIARAGLNLHEKLEYYITVKATNNVGLSTNRSSSSFVIDTTPPYTMTRPTFLTSGFGPSEHFQWENSVLRLEWSFGDDESSILEHIITLRQERNGHTVLENIVLPNQNNFTLILNDEARLRDGDRYTASITACNAAGLCTMNVTGDLLIDSTPPTLGGFHKGMTWKNTEHNGTNLTTLHLLWYGFTDVESGIDRYYITVSESYSGSELSNGIISVKHEQNNIQHANMTLTRVLQYTDNIILSVWAENTFGRYSAIGKISAILSSASHTVDEGFLDIERHSCRSHYCNNDCTCAVVGKKCYQRRQPAKCSEVTLEGFSPNITVFFENHCSFQSLTMSSTCLSFNWTTNVENDTQNVLRYEWSLGIMDEKFGAGIFDTLVENLWYDVGMLEHVTHCLPRGRKLLHRESYVAYVRAWLTNNSYRTFASHPILVDHTPPTIRKGSSIVESIDQCLTDVDSMNSTYEFTICWERTFREYESRIVSFSLEGGTTPGANDFLSGIELSSDRFSYKVDGRQMELGKRYFFTVTATNSLGISNSKTSDGILIDRDQPVAGVVFNTRFHRNVRFQASATTLSVSWHGFDDHQSFIDFFTLMVFQSLTVTLIYKTNSVGLSNSLDIQNLDLVHEETYHIELHATDSVGHISPVVRSESVTIDTTPPIGKVCKIYADGIALSPNATTLFSLVNNQTVYEHLYRTSFNKGDIYKLGILSKEVMQYHHAIIQFDNKEVASIKFAENSDGSMLTEFQFIATDSSLFDLKVKVYTKSITTMIYHCKVIHTDVSDIVQIQQISPHEFAISTFISDPESGVKDVRVAVGTTEGSSQVLPLTQVSLGSGMVFSAIVPHASKLYPYALSSNYAGLYSTFNGPYIKADHTPPQLQNVSQFARTTKKLVKIENDELAENASNVNISSDGLNETNSTSPTTEITVTSFELQWNVHDPESGLDGCFCALGRSAGSSNLVSWTQSKESYCSMPDIEIKDGDTVYASIKCVNKVQLTGYFYSDPFLISYKEPSSDIATLDVLVQNDVSVEHQRPVRLVQSNSSAVYFYWNGFYDNSDSLVYETQISSKGSMLQPWSSPQSKNFKSYQFRQTNKDEFFVEVRAINYGKIVSQPINTTLYVQSSSPSLSGFPAKLEKRHKGFLLDWRQVFGTDVNGPYTFSVTVGSKEGHSDILESMSTTGQSAFLAPESRELSELFVVIKAVSVTGLEAVHRKTFLL